MPDPTPATVGDIERDHAHLTCDEFAQQYDSWTDLYASYGVLEDAHDTYASLERIDDAT